MAALFQVQDVPLIICEECRIEGYVTNPISFSGALALTKPT